MNILLINHYAGSILHGMEYRPYYLAREWVIMGHAVTIAAASVSHVRNVSPNICGAITEELMDGIRYLWIKTPTYSGNGVSRAINIFTFVIQLLLHRTRIAKTVRPDVVIASSTYPLDIIPARAIAMKSNAKVVFEVHDLWPLSPIELGGMAHYHPFIILMQWAENYAYRKSDHIISILPNAMSYMVEHGMSPNNFSHIPNGVDTEEWKYNENDLPDKYENVIRLLKENGNFIVGYTGGHNISNALEHLIESATLVTELPIVFVLVGSGNEKEKLESRVQKLGLRNVIFLPPIPKRYIPALLHVFDVLYLGWRKEPLYRFGISPNKLLDYMMAAKPIIHAVDAANDLVADSECGISIPPENPSAFVEAVKKLMDLTQSDREIMGEKGREYVLANHDYRLLAKQFIASLE